MEKRIEFAHRDRLQAVEHMLPRFLDVVLQLSVGSVLITDESSLTDFTTIPWDDEYTLEPGPFGQPCRVPTPAAEERQQQQRGRELEAMYVRIEQEYYRDVRGVGVIIVDILEHLNLNGVSE